MSAAIEEHTISDETARAICDVRVIVVVSV
jgi:hypothetical protein